MSGVSSSRFDCCAAADDSDDEERTGGAQWIGLVACLASVLLIACLLYALGGPSNLLRAVLRLLPATPGWGWYLTLWLLAAVCLIAWVPLWAPLCLLSGLLFGLLWGTLFNFGTLIFGAAGSIAIGGVVFRDPVRGLVDGKKYPQLRKLLLVVEDSEDTLKLLVLFRFFFLPMFVRNYAFAALNIPAWKLILACVPQSAWTATMMASVGATFKDTAELIRDGKEATLSSIRWQQALVFAVSVSVSLFLTWYAYRKFREIHAEDELHAKTQPAAAAPGCDGAPPPQLPL